MLLFIPASMFWSSVPGDFNTSHVTVYRYSMMLHSPRYSNFNTSHVTVYRVTVSPTFRFNVFQYISCYCLSESDWIPTTGNRISIHLMLLFIRCLSWKTKPVKRISIHLMLLFIISKIVYVIRFLTFQYISCYCLS